MDKRTYIGGGESGRRHSLFKIAWPLLLIQGATALAEAASGTAQVPIDQPGIEVPPGTIEPNEGEPENGLKIARTLCTTCHVIGEPPDSSIAADIPSFPSIANLPDQSAGKLTSWLIEPHAPMPNLHLTRKEIRDLVAYVLTLRTNH